MARSTRLRKIALMTMMISAIDEHRHANADHHPAVDGEILRDGDEVGALPAALALPVGAVDHEFGVHALTARRSP